MNLEKNFKRSEPKSRTKLLQIVTMRPPKPREKQLMDIPGPAGQLQAQHDSASHSQAVTAVLCHPHPQYGGSMVDGVLQTAAEVLLSRGVDCVRFNFRGVGGSAGVYDNGVGEAADLIAVADWVGENYPSNSQWWLGYSFGAAVVWRALQTRSPARAVLIAPPVSMLDFSGSHGDTPIDAIAGDQDDFVDTAKLNTLPGVSAHILTGADHFFTGHHAQLADTLAAVIGRAA